MMNKYKEWFSEVFEGINREQIKTVGLAVFGSNLLYLKSEQKQLIESFKNEFDIGEETYSDRLVFKYIVDYVELYGTDPVTETSTGLIFTKEIPTEKPTLDEVIEEIKKIRERTD